MLIVFKLIYQRGNQVLAHYKGNFVRALCSIFSNIELDETKFIVPSIFTFNSKYIFRISIIIYLLTESYWVQEDNRKWFFNTIAKKLKFDPKIAENWYPIQHDTIMLFQV